MSVGFLTLFTSFNTCQNLASKVLYDDGFRQMGFVTLATLYLSFAICSFFSTAIVRKINNTSLSMSLGGLCNACWVICFLLASWYAEAIYDGEKEDQLEWYL